MASDCSDGCGVALPTLCCFEIATSTSGFGLGQDSQEFCTGLPFIISARALHYWGQSLVMTWGEKPCLTSRSCCLEGRRWGWVRSCRELERESLMGRCGTVPAQLYFLGEGVFSTSFSWDQVLCVPSSTGSSWLLLSTFVCFIFNMYFMNVSNLCVSSLAHETPEMGRLLELSPISALPSILVGTEPGWTVVPVQEDAE